MTVSCVALIMEDEPEEEEDKKYEEVTPDDMPF